MLDKTKPWLESYPKEVKAEVDTHAFENLNDLFDFSCEKYADNIAFYNFSRQITYKQVYTRACKFASFLQNILHLSQGDKIALMMPNIIQYPICLFGAIKAGMTVINVNPMYTPRELSVMLPDCEAKAIVVLENFAHSLEEVIDKTKIKHVVIAKVGDCFGYKGQLINFYLRYIARLVKPYKLPYAITYRQAIHLGGLNPHQEVALHYNDIAFLQYTGGTTGRSKGAMLSHGNIIANVCQATGMYGPKLEQGKEKIVTAIPLYHVFAMTVNLMLMFSIGASNLLITDPRKIKNFIKTLQEHNDITLLTGVNTLFNAIIQHRAFNNVRFDRLKLVIGGGAAVQSAVAAKFYKITKLHILEGYGLTECSPLVSVCPYNINKYTGTIGLPVPSTEVAIIDKNGNFIHDLDVEGELCVKGPQVMQGYFKNDEATKKTIVNGYCHTGDIAVWKAGGYIKLIDRIKDMILVSGFNVFPSELEDVISKMPDVVECAVIGVPSEATGEAICLYVVKKRFSKLNAEMIISYCRENLTAYKVPKIIKFINTLPKNTVGKVLRRALREEYKKSLHGKK